MLCGALVAASSLASEPVVSREDEAAPLPSPLALAPDDDATPTTNLSLSPLTRD